MGNLQNMIQNLPVFLWVNTVSYSPVSCTLHRVTERTRLYSVTVPHS